LQHARKGRRVDVHLILSAHLDAPFLVHHRCATNVVHACSVSETSGVFAPARRAVIQSIPTASGYTVNVSTLPD
jgi:hypothetical protein